jgi:hypothetical protein
VSGDRRGTGTSADRIFPRVNSHRILGVVGLIVAASCGGDDPPTNDPDLAPAATAVTVPLDAGSPIRVAWPAEYGVLIVMPAPSGEGAALIPALAPSVAMAEAVIGPIEGLDIDLFSRMGFAGVGVLSAIRPSVAECPAWPQAPLATDSLWRVGLARGVATAVPLDSIEAMSARDSSRFAISIAELASRVPGDTVEAFRGLPYVIRGAWRSVPDSARELVIALAARTVPIEDDPQSEQLTIIAERDTPTGRWELRFADRRSASESLVDIDEILALVRFVRTGALGVLVERADARGTLLLLIERGADGTWRVRWTGPRTGC